jgi:hypothetical protein
LPHHRYHSNHLVIVVTRAEVGGPRAFVIGEANFVKSLMGPQHGLAETEDLVGPAGFY